MRWIVLTILASVAGGALWLGMSSNQPPTVLVDSVVIDGYYCDLSVKVLAPSKNGGLIDFFDGRPYIFFLDRSDQFVHSESDSERQSEVEWLRLEPGEELVISRRISRGHAGKPLQAGIMWFAGSQMPNERISSRFSNVLPQWLDRQSMTANLRNSIRAKAEVASTGYFVPTEYARIEPEPTIHKRIRAFLNRTAPVGFWRSLESRDIVLGYMRDFERDRLDLLTTERESSMANVIFTLNVELPEPMPTEEAKYFEELVQIQFGMDHQLRWRYGR